MNMNVFQVYFILIHSRCFPNGQTESAKNLLVKIFLIHILGPLQLINNRVEAWGNACSF